MLGLRFSPQTSPKVINDKFTDIADEYKAMYLKPVRRDLNVHGVNNQLTIEQFDAPLSAVQVIKTNPLFQLAYAEHLTWVQTTRMLDITARVRRTGLIRASAGLNHIAGHNSS
jgi:hypothetical protein